MAITANHLVSDIRGIASSGGEPNEFKISDEQILFWVEEIRSILIGQSLAKKDDINDSWIQYIPCVELEQVDAAECCLVDSDCYVLRSVKKIPNTIDTYKDNWIVSVSTMDGTSISKSNPFKSKYQKYNKYTKTQRGWYIKNNYLYVINDQVLELVEVAALFETPSQLADFATCSGDLCFTWDSDYPVSLTLASQITDLVVKTKVQPYFSFPMDNSNNANGATPQQNQQNKTSD